MSQKASWRSGYVVVFVLFVALLVAYLDRVNASILIADSNFLKDMGITDRPDLRGLIMSVFLWTYGCAAFLLSFSLDKLGARRGLIVLAVIWSISMFIGGIAWSYLILILSRIVLGIGEGMQLPLNSMVVKNWAPPKERGMANSIWGTGLFVGSAVTMPLVALIVGSLGWRSSFFILGVVSLIVIIPLVLVFIHNRPQDSPWVSKEELDYIEKELDAEKSIQESKTKEDATPLDSEWKIMLRNTDYWLMIAWWMLNTWMFWGLLSWLPSYLNMARGFTWAQMGGLSSLPYLFGTILLILSGYLMFRIQRSTLFMCTGSLAYVISMTLAIISENNVASALWMAVAMGGICWGFGATFVTLQKIVPAKIIARGTGLFQGIAQLSGGFVPYIIGALIAANNGSFTTGFFFLVIVALLDFCVAMILFTREGRTFGKLVKNPVSDGISG